MKPGLISVLVTLVFPLSCHGSSWNNQTKKFCLEKGCGQICPAVDGRETETASPAMFPTEDCKNLFVDKPTKDLFCEDSDYGQTVCRECKGLCEHPAASVCAQEEGFCRRPLASNRQLHCLGKCGEMKVEQKDGCRTMMGVMECSMDPDSADYVDSAGDIFTDENKVCAGPCTGGECPYVEWTSQDGGNWKVEKNMGSCDGKTEPSSGNWTAIGFGIAAAVVAVVVAIIIVVKKVFNKDHAPLSTNEPSRQI